MKTKSDEEEEEREKRRGDNAGRTSRAGRQGVLPQCGTQLGKQEYSVLCSQPSRICIYYCERNKMQKYQNVIKI